MYAVYWTKGTWLYCSETCMENDNQNAARNEFGSVDSSEYIPGVNAADWLKERGWQHHRCDHCDEVLINQQ